MRYAWLQARRWYLARHTFEDPLRACMRANLPATGTPFEQVEFVALDIETTGLDPASADMVSVGWVVLQNGRVMLDTARSLLVRPSRNVGNSASVHGLTDTVVREGTNWGIALDSIVEALTGRVLLVHHAGLDKGLLDRMCLRRYGARLLVPVVDTMALELRRRQGRHHLQDDASLHLADLRESYGLPRYAAHDAVADAIATGELLAAMVAHRRATTLGELLS
ncbi:MAG TPA: exonuclease domain-containing protein [Woeseiaceae bacterium]|jgi:DNA polymerase-3 subunit epsilon|nr:exonuclease domain-containing protein [Woeseiaceae bacterium]